MLLVQTCLARRVLSAPRRGTRVTQSTPSVEGFAHTPTGRTVDTQNTPSGKGQDYRTHEPMELPSLQRGLYIVEHLGVA